MDVDRRSSTATERALKKYRLELIGRMHPRLQPIMLWIERRWL